MGFWARFGRLGHKIGGGIADVAGGIASGLGAAGAAVAATGIGAPLGALLEGGAAMAGSVALGGKAVDGLSYAADAIGKK